MTMELLRNLMLLGTAGLGLGFLLNFPSTRGTSFDERQRMEQGKAANLAMNTAVAYLLTTYVAFLLEWIPEDHMVIAMVFGLTLTLVVYRSYCIFRDAYLGQFSDPFASALVEFIFGIIWLLLSVSRWKRGESFVWLNLMLCFTYTSEAVCLFIRAMYVRFRDRLEDEE